MPSTYIPAGQVLFGAIPAQYGFLVQPPIVWPSLASQWNAESGTSIQGGRYIPALGEIHSATVPKIQDTYVSGTAGRSGLAFNVVKGGWKDNLYHKQLHCYGLVMSDGGPNTDNTNATAPEVVSTTSFSTMDDCEIHLRRGWPPVYPSDVYATHAPDKCWCYLHLAYQSPDNQDYRIALEYGQPIRLDYTYDGGKTWQAVAVARDLGNVEKYLAANDDEIRITVKPDASGHILGVEIGDGNWLAHKPDASQLNPKKNITSFQGSDPLLPRNGKIRLICRNGSAAMWYLPMRHQDITLTKSTRDYGRQLPNAQSAQVVANSLTQPDDAQQNNITLNTDGQKFSFSIKTSMPAADDGLGSKRPARIANADLIIPPVWDTTVPGTPPGYLDGIGELYNQHIIESEVFDEVTRTASTRALIQCDNTYSQSSGAFGQVAVNVAASVGGPLFQRFCGIGGHGVEGLHFTRQDPVRQLEVPTADKSVMMQVALDDEIILDGWCLFSAVDFLAQHGNTHPQWLQSLPKYRWGRAGYDCPYPILPRGTGNNPRFRYTPEMSAWAILCQLVLDSSAINPNNGLPVPYYHGFDPYGQYHFEPVALYEKDVTAYYSDIDVSGVGQIEWLQVFNSVADMRTELNFLGLDAESYELLFYHLPLPPYCSILKGYRDTWTERNARYASMDYLQYVAQVAAIQASIPQQTVIMRVPFLPWVHAGDLCVISERYTLGRTDLFSIKSLVNHWGFDANGTAESYSIVTARAIQNTF